MTHSILNYVSDSRGQPKTDAILDSVDASLEGQSNQIAASQDDSITFNSHVRKKLSIRGAPKSNPININAVGLRR